MASKETPSPLPALRFPQWQGDYEAALQETDPKVLFKRVEITEAVLLGRREALVQDGDGHVERREIESALTKLRALKKDVLKFPQD